MPQSQPPSLRKRFQSTPSVGRATTTGMKQQQKMSHFNPRPPWGGRQQWTITKGCKSYFNPRPPWGGRRASGRWSPAFQDPFQSTPSVGRATEYLVNNFGYTWISIHALRGVGDGRLPWKKRPKRNFNPRPPWGGRRFLPNHSKMFLYFNPRPPWGGRRQTCDIATAIHAISIHALRGEGDD